MNPSPNKSRIGLFIKKTLNYTRLSTFENNLNSFIWVKLNIKNKKPIYFGGGYRQYTLPCKMGIKNSKSAKNQIDRFSTLLDSWSRGLKSQHDTIVSMDSNVDFYPLTRHRENYLDKKLF